jgi:hypothetical protein
MVEALEGNYNKFGEGESKITCKRGPRVTIGEST